MGRDILADSDFPLRLEARPTSIEAILSTDEARLKGCRRIRAGNESGAKVSPQQSGKVSPAAKGGAKSLKVLERVKGIEPSSSAWKAVALPLSYTRIAATAGARTPDPLVIGVLRPQAP
jgi:hypothetical protein